MGGGFGGGFGGMSMGGGGGGPSLSVVAPLDLLRQRVRDEQGVGADSWFYYTGGAHAAQLFTQRREQLVSPPVATEARA